MSDHGLISSYEGHKERRTGEIRGDFSRMHRAFWTAGCWPARGFITSSRPPRERPRTSIFQFSLFLYVVWP